MSTAENNEQNGTGFHNRALSLKEHDALLSDSPGMGGSEPADNVCYEKATMPLSNDAGVLRRGGPGIYAREMSVADYLKGRGLNELCYLS